MGEARERTRAELWFHIGLATVILPVITLPVVWTFAIMTVRDAGADDRWARRLIILAIFDTLVAAAIVVSTLMGMQEALSAPAPGRARIGVLVEETDDGVRVMDVIEGSPAERAGIEAGDVIVRARDREVQSSEALLEELGRGGAADLAIRRAGRSRSIRVEPSEHIRTSAPTRCPSPSQMASAVTGWSFLPYAFFVLGAAILWIGGRVRGVRQWTAWLPLLGILLASSIAGTIGGWLACTQLGVEPAHAGPAGLLVAELVMSSLAILWLSLTRPPAPADERPRWSFARTYATALLYAFAWMTRVAWLVVPLVWASRELGIGEVSTELTALLGGGRSDLVVAVLVFTSAAVLAPIAEECLFRGVVMPHLARAYSPWTALYASSILFGLLHVAHGVMFVGPMVLGAILGWARLRSRGMAVPIALHATFNATATLVSWLA